MSMENLARALTRLVNLSALLLLIWFLLCFAAAFFGAMV